MSEFFARSHFETAAAAIRKLTQLEPKVGLILGSGLNPLAKAIENSITIPYGEIPHFSIATVKGHIGQLIVGQLEGQSIIVMQGRAHYYEGYSMDEIVFPIRVMQVLGIESLIITNAAGGLNPDFASGDVMLINDHINLIGMCGLNPLRGPNLDEFGPRFPDMSEPYDAHLRTLAKQVAAKANVPLREGVYICLSGPTFETRADLRFLRLIGADAVGMSTVPETTVARHGGTRVLGLSGISNVALPENSSPVETTHKEVLETGQVLVPRLETIIRGVLRTL
ncbi:MAG: purine-nucleoside phosphorylase [Chloroflexi bacterium]|nr:purine-nucleoside phosphorylase [Chloroflexota bacterium]